MAQSVEILVFELDDQRYALPLVGVQEVVRAVALTRLPGAPPIIEGAIDVRGRVVPVLDLRARFGLPPRPLHPDQHLILARAGKRLVAIRVDRVSWFLEVDPVEIATAASITPTVKRIAGVARVADGLVLIHDLETFLTAAEAETLARVLES
jgi:purine-binding chemotaxis protein CheW